MALPYETEPAWRISQPWVRWEWVTSQTSRDFPTPGSPTIATTWPCPSAARPSASRSCSSSASRPTKRREPPRGRRGEPRAPGPRARQLVGLHRRRQPLDRHRAERLHLDVPFRQAEGVGGQERRARAGELLHAGGQVGGLADGRVVHVEVARDRAHHHLAGVEAHPGLDGDAVGLPERPRSAAASRAAGRSRRSTPAPRGPRGRRGAPNSAMIPSPMTWLTVPS